MDKRIPRSEFAAALEASGAKLKPQVAEDPAKALKKVQGKARDKLLAQLGIPGGMKLTASIEGQDVLLHAEGEDRFAAAGDVPKMGRFGKAKAAPAPGDTPVPPKKGLFGKPKQKDVAEATKAAERPVAQVAMAPDGKGPIWKPPLKASERELDIYPTNAPFAWVRIVNDVEQHEMTYNVLEPPLSEREQRVLTFIEDTLVDVLEIPLSALNDKQAKNVLLEHVNQIIYDYSILIEEQSKAKLLYFVERDFLGYGLIDAVMKDDQIEDVSCDGPHVPIFLYHRKHESLKSNIQFVTDEALDGFVIRLAQRSGKHISIAEPLLDATLPDGSRLNSTLSDEVTSCGSTFTVRKFKQVPFTPPDLVRFGTMSADLLAYWWMAVQYGASAIYSGGTASGKTTSLNAILLFIPPTMKVVSIEDTREINLPHPNWIPGVTRSGFGPRDDKGRQAGEIDMFTLLKAALRQRPEYILVGEVRGQEAFALFQAMATGHTAYGTMHADSVEAVIHRLEGEPINIPRTLLESLDVVSVQIQTRINGKRVRRTKELVEIVGLDPHTKEILTNTVFLWNPATDQFEYSGVSYVLERIQAERNWTPEMMRAEWDNRKEIIRWLIDRDVRDFRAVAKVITAYYKEPEQLLKFIRSTVLDPGAKGPGALPPLLAGDVIAGMGLAAAPLEAGSPIAAALPGAAPAPLALPGDVLPAALEAALQPHEAEVEAMVQQFESAAAQAQAEAAAEAGRASVAVPAKTPPNEDVRPKKPGSGGGA